MSAQLAEALHACADRLREVLRSDIESSSQFALGVDGKLHVIPNTIDPVMQPEIDATTYCLALADAALADWRNSQP